MSVKIFVVDGSDTLDDYELENVYRLNADVFAYYYVIGDYDGCGWAAWRKGDMYGYGDMDHCSCYGPTESLVGVKAIYSLAEIKAIAKNDDYHEHKAPEVVGLLAAT
jgi:hypothetical protein